MPRTTEIPDVRPGQIWEDADNRNKGRTVRVDAVDDGKAACTILTNSASTQEHLDAYNRPGRYPSGPILRDTRGKTTRISVTRFKPTSTGYRLIEDAPTAHP